MTIIVMEQLETLIQLVAGVQLEVAGQKECSNGIDDDGDGYIDCNDFDCDGDPACPFEICDDGIDNDGDSYIDCDDFGCSDDPACSSGDGGGGPCDDSSLGDLFFSEYGEGSSNNKYLEIYNNSSETIDLCGYTHIQMQPMVQILRGHMTVGMTLIQVLQLSPGDVYVLCHGSSDNLIQQHCDQNHTYLSNGDDGFCLGYGSENGFQTLDCIGDWSATDPGDGWTVAGVKLLELRIKHLRKRTTMLHQVIKEIGACQLEQILMIQSGLFMIKILGTMLARM